jgi:purine nucleosidase
LALLLLLHLQDVSLLGVTTVYGNVLLRAKIAQRILSSAGRDVPVIVGTGVPMESPFPIWHSGEEGVGLLSDEEMRPALGRFQLGDNAPGFLVNQIMRRPGQVTVLAIGALTNIALALESEPHLTTAIRRLVFMGAGVTYPHPLPEAFRPGDEYIASRSHNVGCDVEAARRVFQSGVKISALTNDVTTRVWWGGATVRQFLQAVEPAETEAVAKLLRVWLKYRTHIFRRPIKGIVPNVLTPEKNAV